MTPAARSSHHDGIDLTWGAVSDVGKVRRLNEDSYLEAPGAFVVADGMGGHQAGDVASRLTIEAVQSLLADGVPDVESIASVVQLANASVRSHADTAGQHGMGSTLVGAFVVRNADEDSIVVVNVGDSRCYSMRDGLVTQLTRDHSHVQELVDSGEISADAAVTHPERNVVTRAIGIEDVVAGDFFVLPAVDRLRLLLCSDGVSGELGFDAIGSVLAAHADPLDAAQALIAAVLEGRAADNATAIVVDVRRSDLVSEAMVDDPDVTGPRPRVAVDPEITAPVPRQAFPPPTPDAVRVEVISTVPGLEAGSAPPTPPTTPGDSGALISGVPG
ncbi:MAG: protein phosphatase 2C domain-containing protein [Ilumatobacteraceae bacterium]